MSVPQAGLPGRQGEAKRLHRPQTNAATPGLHAVCGHTDPDALCFSTFPWQRPSPYSLSLKYSPAGPLWRAVRGPSQPSQQISRIINVNHLSHLCVPEANQPTVPSPHPRSVPSRMLSRLLLFLRRHLLRQPFILSSETSHQCV